jgi:signal transduction histidine kinase
MARPRMKLGALMQAGLGKAGLGTRRLERLAAAVQAWRDSGSNKALDTGLADAGGDAVSRLAADIELMTQHVAGQNAALARAERQQRELLAKVSHDLRTPLASMRGYLELMMLRQGSLDPAEERNYLQTAIRQSERLARLVNDLFELTRLQAEGMRPATEDFALAELAHDVVQKFARQAQQRSVQLTAVGCNTGAAALRVRADLGLVERVFDNLVENALRHTPAAGTVTIELAQADCRARILVRDSGEGIASDQLEGIFDRYLDSERTGDGGPRGHGGLGLAIARRIALLHGSELEVRSTRGQGTEVGFDLPLVGTADTRTQASSTTRHP